MKNHGKETDRECVEERPSRRFLVRAAFAYDGDSLSRRTGLRCLDPSRTDQSGKEEADINTIIRNFGVTGVLPMAKFPPTYGDFSMAGDYQTAMDLLVEAKNAFMGIPATIRATFNNDPAAFVAFCDDPANLPQLQSWGLAPSPEAPPHQEPGPTKEGS